MPKICSYQKNADSLLLITDHGNIKLQCCSGGILRVVYTLRDEFSNRESLMVTSRSVGNINFDVDETDEIIIMLMEKLNIRINKETAAINYYDRDGGILLKEPEKGGKTLFPVEVINTVFDASTKVKIEQSVDGARSIVDGEKHVIDRIAYTTKLELCFEKDEALYGLGSHEEGVMNLRGSHQYLYQHNLKGLMPILVSTKGYGLLFDCYSAMTFRDDMHGAYIWSEFSDEMDFYFIYGPKIDDIINGYRKLTGKVPMLPKWAFGYIQSKERYETQQELIDVVREYRRRNIPLDCIVLDWRSWEGELWGQKSFDKTRFPSAVKMMEELHALHTRLMVSVWPNMTNDGPNQIEMKQHGYLLGNQSTYDAFNPFARELYFKQANEGIFENGTDAWWCDCSEPFESDWKGAKKPEPEERLLINTSEAKKYIDPAYINAYSLLHSKGIYEGQRKTTDEKRVVNLTRSSYGGQQRYATITWSGDISANWETLKKQIAGGLNFCVSGAPYWTLDIGGFFVSKKEQWFWCGDYDNGFEDDGYKELYTRWIQFGAFLPMFRSHGTDTPREVWRFGEPGTRFYDTIVNFISFRYRLMPYIYSLAFMVTTQDYTMMRALPFDFVHDKNTLNIDDQYMFGPAIMVNPVVKPMYYGKNSKTIHEANKTREVYLPMGCEWVDFWTGKRLNGGNHVIAAAPLEYIPLYIKAGSILPLGEVKQYTAADNQDIIELRIYDGTDGSFSLYEDEGDNYNYENGYYSNINISWIDISRTLIIERREGSFKGYIPKITFNVVLVSENHGTGITETTQSDKTAQYIGEKLIIEF